MYTEIRALETPTSTTVELQTLLTMLAMSSVEKVDMFAGHAAGGETAIVLLATGRFAGIGPAHVLYDCLTLSVRDAARYAEVRELLDLAVASKKCFFSEARAFATCTLPAKHAIAELRALKAEQLLTHASRKTFFALLSDLSEADITDVKPS